MPHSIPILEELAKEYHGKILVYKVDTQKEQQISAELGIQSIPTFIFFPVDGKPFATSGIASTPRIPQNVRRNY
jgi:thioredoxin-like negative regulator of GroEL